MEEEKRQAVGALLQEYAHVAKTTARMLDHMRVAPNDPRRVLEINARDYAKAMSVGFKELEGLRLVSITEKRDREIINMLFRKYSRIASGLAEHYARNGIAKTDARYVIPLPSGDYRKAMLIGKEEIFDVRIVRQEGVVERIAKFLGVRRRPSPSPQS